MPRQQARRDDGADEAAGQEHHGVPLEDEPRVVEGVGDTVEGGEVVEGGHSGANSLVMPYLRRNISARTSRAVVEEDVDEDVAVEGREGSVAVAEGAGRTPINRER